MKILHPLLRVLPLCAVLLVSCKSDQAQRDHLAGFFSASREAAANARELQPFDADVSVFGEGTPLANQFHQSCSRWSQSARELNELLDTADTWTIPDNWRDKNQVKTIRQKAERLLTLVNEYHTALSGISSDGAILRVKEMKLGSGFKTVALGEMKRVGPEIAALKTFLDAVWAWGQAEVEILALVDDKLVRIHKGVPIFPSEDDSVAYRIALRHVRESQIHMLGVAKVTPNIHTERIKRMYTMGKEFADQKTS